METLKKFKGWIIGLSAVLVAIDCDIPEIKVIVKDLKEMLKGDID